jgi:branched-chain amino acid transport system substrate-binding protein
MRKAFWAVLAGLAVVALGPPARADVTVGIVMSMTGPVSSIGLPYMKGFAAALAGTGEVAQQRIKVLQIDDRSDPSAAAQAGKKMIEDDRVDVLVGSAGTPASLALYSVASEAGVPLIVTGNVAVEGERGVWEITIPQPSPLMIEAVAEHMQAHGIKTVGFLGFNDAWGDTVHDGLKVNADPRGIRIIADERYSRTDTSVTPQTLKLMAAHPDAMMTGGSGAPAALPHLALAERGWHGPVYSSHAIINSDFLRVAGKSAEGVVAPTGPLAVADQLPDSNPIKAATAEFRRLYQKANNDDTLNPFAGYAYDSFLVLFDATKRAIATGARPGTPAFRVALRDALVSTREVVGTQAVYTFTPGRRFGTDARARVLVTLSDGQWKLIK